MANSSARTEKRISDVTVNGRGLSTGAATLADLVVEQGFGGSKVATAVNGDFVPQRARETITLRDGDTIEILSARQGG